MKSIQEILYALGEAKKKLEKDLKDMEELHRDLWNAYGSELSAGEMSAKENGLRKQIAEIDEVIDFIASEQLDENGLNQYFARTKELIEMLKSLTDGLKVVHEKESEVFKRFDGALKLAGVNLKWGETGA